MFDWISGASIASKLALAGILLMTVAGYIGLIKLANAQLRADLAISQQGQVLANSALAVTRESFNQYRQDVAGDLSALRDRLAAEETARRQMAVVNREIRSVKDETIVGPALMLGRDRVRSLLAGSAAGGPDRDDTAGVRGEPIRLRGSADPAGRDPNAE